MTMDDADIAFLFSLPPKLEKLFRLLLLHSRVTTAMIVAELGAKADAKMTIFRLRKYLAESGHEVDIKSKRHLGYWIERDDKSRLMEKMNITLPSN